MKMRDLIDIVESKKKSPPKGRSWNEILQDYNRIKGENPEMSDQEVWSKVNPERDDKVKK